PRSVALKCLKTELSRDANTERRFLYEAEVTAQLEHPGVVPIYGLVRDPQGTPWYAMRFIEGDDLAAGIAKYYHQPPDPVAFRQLLQRFVGVCQTMAYAHSRGVIHRDLKPANVMLGAFGETLVVDWGLAGSAAQPAPHAGTAAPVVVKDDPYATCAPSAPS